VLQSKLFYAFASRMTGGLIVPNSSTYRAFTFRVLESIKSMPEKASFLRALAMYVGFSSKGINFPRESRVLGQSKAAGSVVLKLGLRGIVSNSTKPLDFIGIFGLALGVVAVSTTILFSGLWVTSGVPFAGFGTIMGVILLAFAGLFFAIGIIAQYLSLIFEEVKSRPSYILANSVGYPDEE
jgi:dolichol-phosphate mannosyltransferase